MENREIARLLAETADLMEIAGEDPFRIRSYRKAADVIEGYAERIEEIVGDRARKVTDIPGIGKGLAAVLAEILARGSFERRDEMLEKYPPTALELLKIQGLGPKSIALLWEHYRVSPIDDLERVCLDQKLRLLTRMGAKLEEKVLRSISYYRQSAGRFTLSFAARLVEDLTAWFGSESVTAAGEYRRSADTVGEIDLLAAAENAPAAIERFLAHPQAGEVLSKSEECASARIGQEGLRVNLRTVPRARFGTALVEATGSESHIAALRDRAAGLGLPLPSAETEEALYAALGLAWIPPELRENAGEIEAAAEGHLPVLVEHSQIRGDLHMHTNESDGRGTLEEMAEAARALGYEYIAITDHSKSLAMANGLDERRAVEFAARVRQFNASGPGIHVFSGLECDIRRDGSMDLSDSALAELDFVVASVHSYMNLEAAEMTNRLLRALENPHVRALGHPTGRVLLHRDAFRFDFEVVAREAARRGVLLEINSSPERLDLHAPLIRRAKALGARFVVSTDSHHPKHLPGIRFGVGMARRGWLEAQDVVNTYPLEQFRRAIRLS
jgi:DNA polymerase (family 10)